MSNIQGQKLDHAAIERVVIQGDLAKLTPEQRIGYYTMLCQSLGLNPLTKPFEFLTLNGKLVMYARKDATDQLRRVHRISVEIKTRDCSGDQCAVIARASMPDGRCDEATGVVATGGLKGDALANAQMKAETKAKRRVTLSICGLGFLDETEVETIKDAKAQPHIYNPDHKTQTVKDLVHRPPDKSIPAAKDGTYIVTFGKFKGQMITDIDTHELENYCQYLLKSAEEQGKEIKGQVLEFIEAAEKCIEALPEPSEEIDVALSADWNESWGPKPKGLTT